MFIASHVFRFFFHVFGVEQHIFAGSLSITDA